MNLTEQEIRKLQDLAGIVTEATEYGITDEALKIAKELTKFILFDLMSGSGISGLKDLEPEVAAKFHDTIKALSEYIATAIKIGNHVTAEKAKNKASEVEAAVSKIYDEIDTAISNKNQKAYKVATGKLSQFITADTKNFTQDLKDRAPDLKKKAKKAGF